MNVTDSGVGNPVLPKRRILVVDDERIVAEDLSESLQDLGYEVVGLAANAAKAISLAHEHRPDLICMDIVIKGDRDGIEAATEIWDDLAIASVFTTAYSDDATVTRAKAANPAGYLVKPYDLSTLRCTIDVALAKTDADLQLREHALALAERAEEKTVQLEQVQTQLYEAQKMEAVGTLTGGIAHDFNNMLLPILGYSQLLAEGLEEIDGAPDLVGHAREIHRAATSAASLTRQLLAFSRRQILAKQVHDINALAVESKNMLQRVLGEEVTLQFEFPSEPAHVMADAGQIEQVLLNLCINARDAMKAGGHINVCGYFLGEDEARRRELGDDLSTQWYCVSVEDNGAGMGADTAARVFEPFFSTKGNMGTGLGLSVVHGIITQHDGDISVSSQLGEGTRFDIFLPLSAAEVVEDDAAVEILPARGTVEAGGERILVIEDEPQVRLFVARALGNKGYQVETAYDLASARQVLERERASASTDGFDLIFSDCVLPDGNGVDFLREELGREPQTKAILTTGYTDREALVATASEHDVAFLQKPYPLPKLFEAIRAKLDGDALAIAG